MTAFEVRAVTEDEWPALVRTDRIAFGMQASEDDVLPERRPWDLDRSVAAFEGTSVVGAAGAYSFDLTLPGLATAPAAGVTWVGVLPTHTRRGVLTAMMRHQLADVHARGEPLAVLLASESLIYGRFGYGIASTQPDYELERAHAEFDRRLEAPGRVVLLDEPGARSVLTALHERVRRLHPGDLSRTDGWWDAFWRGGGAGRNAGPRFVAVYEAPGAQPEGYAVYRILGAAPQKLAAARSVLVQGLAATTDEAYAALWRFVCDVDLSERIIAPLRRVDEPLRWMLRDPRRLHTTRSLDYLWCRLVDVGTALAARRYEVEATLVLDVSDAFCPWNEGRWRIEASPAGATCVPARRDEAELALTAAELGALYLGGTTARTLARAGRITELRPGALALADRLFASDPAPWCQTFF